MTLANPPCRLNPCRFPLPRRFLVTDDQRCPNPLPLLRRLSAGDGVLFRHYQHPERDKLARLTARLCREKRLRLIIAADWRLAARLHADGVHLPQNLGQSGLLAPLRLWCRRHRTIISMACHDRRALTNAARLGANLVTLSPVFPTASHPTARGLGACRFAQWARLCPLPVLALGGIRPSTVKSLRYAHGIAATV